MKSRHRTASSLLALMLLVTVGEARAAGLVGKWVGQDGHDLVGGEPGPSKSDYQDIHIALKGLPTDRDVVEVEVRGFGGGVWITSNPGRATVLLVRQGRSGSAEIYIEPYMPELGREFEIKLKLDDGRRTSLYVQGGKADPNLKTAGSGVEARWLGQDGRDRTGLGPGVGPDGFMDVHIALSRLSSQSEIRAVEITGPGGLAWHSGTNPKGLPGAELVRLVDKTKADLYFSPPRDLAGVKLKVAITYEGDRGDSASVVGLACNPSKASARVAAPNLETSKATARWLGQDGVQTDPGDVHVVVEGLSPTRPIAAAALSDGVMGTWVYQSSDQFKIEAGYGAERLQIRRVDPRKADLVFPSVRDESGATMTLRLVDPSGHEEVIRFPGGPGDPTRRAPELSPGTVRARPGDNLQEMVERAGTVTLAKGDYPLTRPLILSRPTRIVGEAGSTLRFKQGQDQPPWTAAIKLHAGGTSLEGFAVRFDGPVRWLHEVAFGPAVIGTTDDRDNVPKDPKHRVEILKLDLQAPPPWTDWEEATHLIRLMSASSGRVEGNTLKGGTIQFEGGPWTLSGNTYRGTLPHTYSPGVFAGRSVHDVAIVGNKAGDEGPSGKTWRFLVLTQRGAFDLIKDNVVGGGIGAREDDPHPHQNEPEVMLTEAYRLRFEGRPSSLSSDGRVVTIPEPQGGEASTGDVLAILSGPQAGQWRAIAQPLGPRAYLLDAPIDRSTDVVSIATGFVLETFEGNTVDTRGSGIASNLVLAGHQYGVKVLRNHFLGGGESVRLVASSTESPVRWGWSHTAFLGALVEGNILEDAIGGGLGVEHGAYSRSNKGRVYLSMTFKDNTIRWARPSKPASKPPRFQVGYPPSLDPKELLLVEEGTKVEGGDPKSAWVHAATINGRVVEEAPLNAARGSVGANESGAKR